MKYLDAAYTINERTRHAQAEWHEVVLSICRCAAVFRDSGNSPREADQMYSYVTTFALHAARHLDRLANSNGHNKDSSHAIDSGALEPSAACNSQALADEESACTDCGHGEAIVTPDASPVTAVPSNDVEGRIELLIDQLGDLMAKQTDHQPYEVALKILHRGRSILRSGTDDKGRPLPVERKEELATRHMRAAFNTVHGLKQEVF